MDALRLLIADDHPLFRDGLKALIALQPDIEWVGEAATGDEAVALAERLQPDVVLMDIQMPGARGAPGLNGIEAARRIVYASPHIGVIMLTMFDDDGSVFAAMRAGARGYILKGAIHAETLQAIRTVGAGGAIFSPAIAVRLMEFFAHMRPTPPQVFPELSDREREILNLIARGHNNVDIAKALALSPKTIRNYVSNILDKLQVADRAEAIVRAREAGLGDERKPG
jgi:DNA-binding NarL/FixJ family response regulator